MITLDVPGRSLSLEVDEATLKARRAEWKAPPATKRGWVKLYIEHVLQASEGADLDFLVGSSGTPPRCLIRISAPEDSNGSVRSPPPLAS